MSAMDIERTDQKWRRWGKPSKCCFVSATKTPRDGVQQSPVRSSQDVPCHGMSLTGNSHTSQLLTPQQAANNSPRSPGAAELQRLISYLKEGSSRVKAVAAEGKLHGHVQR
jgi:hypothetical protein